VRDAAQRGVGGVFLGAGAVSLLGSADFGNALKVAPGRPFVAVDEEGGRVQRIATVIGDIPSPRIMQRTKTAKQITALASTRGAAMHALGVTMDFAPVVDVSSQPDDGAIGDRSFSVDPSKATTDAVAFAKGLAAAGVRPVFKHFPGHGRAVGNSHDGLVTTPPLTSLRDVDLIPYRIGLAEAATVSVMVGHLIVPGLTEGQPASVSRPAITGLLRDELGFRGLVITDDLGLMRGILDLYTTQQAAVRAAEAGADLLLVPEPDVASVVQGILNAVSAGELPEAQLTASADRILSAQGSPDCR
jgi:beta-N-acetylhexosaminidase